MPDKGKLFQRREYTTHTEELRHFPFPLTMNVSLLMGCFYLTNPRHLNRRSIMQDYLDVDTAEHDALVRKLDNLDKYLGFPETSVTSRKMDKNTKSL